MGAGPAEQTQLDLRPFQELLRYQKIEKRLIFRTQIALLSQRDQSKEAIATVLRTTSKTVAKWQTRTARFGIIGLRDEPRSGRPKIIDAEIQAKVIHLATHLPYKEELLGFSTMSLRLVSWVMEQRKWTESISHEAVRQILRDHRLQVHRVKYWKTSTDPNFAEKMKAIVDLYINPPSGKLVVCVDEMPSVQALERIGASQPMAPGKPRRMEYEYKRHGTTNLLAAFNISDGHVFAETYAEKKHPDFFDFMKKVDAHFGYEDMIVIVDNYKTHNHQVIKEWRQQQNGRIQFVFTPYHGSWLNQIEIWFGIVRRHCLRHANFTSLEELKLKLLQFIATWNEHFAHPFKWKFAGW
jgi:transposase